MEGLCKQRFWNMCFRSPALNWYRLDLVCWRYEGRLKTRNDMYVGVLTTANVHHAIITPANHISFSTCLLNLHTSYQAITWLLTRPEFLSPPDTEREATPGSAFLYCSHSVDPFNLIKYTRTQRSPPHLKAVPPYTPSHTAMTNSLPIDLTTTRCRA